MKKQILLFIFMFSVTQIFSQNVPNDIILSYQIEIESWIEKNIKNYIPKILKQNEIELFYEPYINEEYPETKIFGKGGSIIDCFSLGKFLTILEKEKLYELMYSCISHDIRQKFLPFKSFENFKNSLVFNPKILFNKPDYRGLNRDFNERDAFLILYFGPYYEGFFDTVFNTQLKQLTDKDEKNFLIIPYSFNYALFKIDDKGIMELVNYYGIN